jgi:two-component system nitrate/nitrite response regulator NarL
MINLLIADDHQVVIDGLKSLLSLEDDFQVVGEAQNGKMVLEALKDQKIDVVLLDINMPEMDGIETARRMREQHPNVKILILTMYNRPEFIRNIIEVGASGYVLKNVGKEELINSIRKVERGEDYFSLSVTNTLMDSFKSGTESSKVELTKRERGVLTLIAEGNKTSEIAEKLFISTHTVNTHRKNLLSKLNIKNTAGLVRYAIENGFTKPNF